MARKRPSEAAPAPPNLDFRAPGDDAWYEVRLAVEEDVEGEAALRVMYCNFSGAFDELYPADRFASLRELEEFAGRFRPTSVQLQDEECRMVVEGTEFCASHTFGDRDVRFYDAVVESVRRSKHRSVNGEAICNCTFEVLWKHGPLAGESTPINVQDICIMEQKWPQNPTLDHFLDIARNRFDGNDKTSKQAIDPERSPLKPMFGEKNYYAFWIDNLEKDLSPMTMNDFIYEQTSLSSQVELSYSVLPVMSCSGMVLLRTEKDAKKLLDFLLDPAHIVVSSRGRPWFVRDDWCRKFEGAMPRYEVKRSNRVQQDSSKLKLAYKGTKEYERAKELQGLRCEFHNHLECIYRRLESEERILLTGRE
ncbi:uncharacterized protein LOC103995526 [Musa acuminata AAA Group]|uniref:uncharacterized protein LOC103995526 n=1 Tax=Musa acuminata AAA Group TaxID=214697 RepID=UPI0031D19700